MSECAGRAERNVECVLAMWPRYRESLVRGAFVLLARARPADARYRDLAREVNRATSSILGLGFALRGAASLRFGDPRRQAAISLSVDSLVQPRMRRSAVWVVSVSAHPYAIALAPGDSLRDTGREMETQTDTSDLFNSVMGLVRTAAKDARRRRKNPSFVETLVAELCKAHGNSGHTVAALYKAAELEQPADCDSARGKAPCPHKRQSRGPEWQHWVRNDLNSLVRLKILVTEGKPRNYRYRLSPDLL